MIAVTFVLSCTTLALSLWTVTCMIRREFRPSRKDHIQRAWGLPVIRNHDGER